MTNETDAGGWDIGEPRWNGEWRVVEFQAYRAGVSVRFRIPGKVFEDRYQIGSASEMEAALVKYSGAIKAGAARKLDQLRPQPEGEIKIELGERGW